MISTVVENRTRLYSASQKNPPPRGFLTFFSNGWEFLIDFYTPIVCFYLR